MSAKVINAVLCERITGRERATLESAGLKWRSPPPTLAVWIELSNTTEAEFTVSVQIWRGAKYIDESETEQVLEGRLYWQSKFEFSGTEDLEAKSHRFIVLVNSLPVRTIVTDLGSPEGM